MAWRLVLWLGLLLLAGCETTSGVQVPSVNYYDRQVVTLHPQVFRVEGEDRPTVLVLHGSGGVEKHHLDWARQLNSWNFNAVVFNSFSPRGYRDSVGALAKVPALQRAIDAQRVAEWVRRQPWGQRKIGVLGFSHGGMAVYEIVGDGQLSRELGHAPLFAAAVSLYGPVQSHNLFSQPVMPYQMHVGKLDNGVDYHSVEDLHKVWKQGEFYAYDNAFHGYDRDGVDFTVPGGADGYLWAYRIKSDAAARDLTFERVRAFFSAWLDR